MHPCRPRTEPCPEKPSSILHTLLARGETLFLSLEGLLQAGGPGSEGSAALRAEPPQHTLNTGIRLAANGCLCLCRVGRKKKQYTPKPKAWKEERSPPKSKASAPFKQNNSTGSGGRGVREETHKHKPQRLAGSASPNHLIRRHLRPTPQHPCVAPVGAGSGNEVMWTCRGRFWRTTQWAAGENKT